MKMSQISALIGLLRSDWPCLFSSVRDGLFFSKNSQFSLKNSHDYVERTRWFETLINHSDPKEWTPIFVTITNELRILTITQNTRVKKSKLETLKTRIFMKNHDIFYLRSKGVIEAVTSKWKSRSSVNSESDCGVSLSAQDFLFSVNLTHTFLLKMITCTDCMVLKTCFQS